MKIVTFLRNQSLQNKVIYALFFGIVCVYLLGIFIPIMEVDAAQYAFISNQMLLDQSFLEIKYKLADYLDKPPLLFWLSSSSIALFGTTSFAYKFPSILALLLAVYSTYKLCRIYYSKETATFSAMIVASCQALILMGHDIRTDNLLMTFSMLGIWKFFAYTEKRNSKDLLIFFVAIALSMLAKGPLGLVFPFFTIGIVLFHKQKYKAFFHLNWLWAIPIFVLILLPMCIGLYTQHGLEGLEFYFWTQSFGRITGDSSWNNQTDPFFLVHSFLWAFLPYSIFFLLAIYTIIKNFFTQRKNISFGQYFCVIGVILTMIALSMSRYKLPHYIYIISPLAAILSAEYICGNLTKKALKILYRIQLIFLILLLIFSYFLTSFFLGKVTFFYVFIPILIWIFWKIKQKFPYAKRIIFMSALGIIFVNIQLNTLFYPNLLKYQSASEAAFFMKEKGLQDKKLANYRVTENALSYYTNQSSIYYQELNQIPKEVEILYTNINGMESLTDANVPFTILKELEHYHVTRLTGPFLNPKTRASKIEKRFLVQLKR